MTNYYIFKGSGHALGAVVVIASNDAVTAFSEAGKWAKEQKLTGKLTLDRVVVTNILPNVIYGWNGDY